MKGGIVTRFASWCGNVAIGLIVIGAILIAVIGRSDTGALYSTGATYGGTSTGITLASIPLFFGSVRNGQTLVKAAPASGEPTAEPSKKSAKN